MLYEKVTVETAVEMVREAAEDEAMIALQWEYGEALLSGFTGTFDEFLAGMG